MITPLQKRNRKRIVEFLLTRIPKNRFDFTKLQMGEPEEPVPNLDNPECGTVGCAMGWTPVCFPGQVFFRPLGRGLFTVVHKKTGDGQLDKVAEHLFGISQDDAYHLFNYDLRKDEPFVANHACGPQASAAEVANRLAAYFQSHL